MIYTHLPPCPGGCPPAATVARCSDPDCTGCLTVCLNCAHDDDGEYPFCRLRTWDSTVACVDGRIVPNTLDCGCSVVEVLARVQREETASHA